jgi:hypothetical protein
VYGAGYFWMLVVAALVGAVIAVATGQFGAAIGIAVLAVIAGLTALAKRS